MSLTSDRKEWTCPTPSASPSKPLTRSLSPRASAWSTARSVRLSLSMRAIRSLLETSSSRMWGRAFSRRTGPIGPRAATGSPSVTTSTETSPSRRMWPIRPSLGEGRSSLLLRRRSLSAARSRTISEASASMRRSSRRSRLPSRLWTWICPGRSRLWTSSGGSKAAPSAWSSAWRRTGSASVLRMLGMTGDPSRHTGGLCISSSSRRWLQLLLHLVAVDVLVTPTSNCW